jgi:phosphatidylserine decarboxylase
MPSLQKPEVGTTTVKWRVPAVHPEGNKYIVIAAALVAISWLFSWKLLTWPLIGLTLWVAAFFRDPVRVTPQGEGMIVAPADGLITMIEQVQLPPELRGPNGMGEEPLLRVSIFMSVFDVHINRAPIAGTIQQVIYIAGKFLNADLDKASEENERQHVIVEGRDGCRVAFTQIAGLVARRIVSFVKPGDMVAVGQRVGLIRFGSRVDVYLPPEYGCMVALGQRTIAGETVLAREGATAAIGIAQ